MSIRWNPTNIYARYRAGAGLTQERAAELLGVSPGTVKAWECGESVPCDDNVVLMVDVYQAPTLAVEHLRAVSQAARDLLPDIQPRSLSEAACGLLAAIREFEVDESDIELMKIAADGKVSGDEEKRYAHIMCRLFDIVDAAYALRMCRWEGS